MGTIQRGVWQMKRVLNLFSNSKSIANYWLDKFFGPKEKAEEAVFWAEETLWWKDEQLEDTHFMDGVKYRWPIKKEWEREYLGEFNNEIEDAIIIEEAGPITKDQIKKLSKPPINESLVGRPPRPVGFGSVKIGGRTLGKTVMLYLQTIKPEEINIGEIISTHVAEKICRVCGCTDLDCSGCIERTGEPCYWVNDTLCSACADE